VLAALDRPLAHVRFASHALVDSTGVAVITWPPEPVLRAQPARLARILGAVARLRGVQEAVQRVGSVRLEPTTKDNMDASEPTKGPLLVVSTVPPARLGNTALDATIWLQVHA
jgi:hypothetical protein